MSRILRRPMFRGGPASSDGVGITSGLNNPRQEYADGPTDEGVQPSIFQSIYDAINPSTETIVQRLQKRQQEQREPLIKTQSYREEQKKLAEIKKAAEKFNTIGTKSGEPEEDITQKYTLPTLEQDIDSYSKLLLDKAGSDKDEYTRQKYLTLAKFGFNLLKPTPAGIKPSLLSSIATAAEKPLEEYGNISMQESKEGRASRQLAAQLAFQKHMPGNMAKSVQDLMSVNPKMTVEEAISVVTTGKNKAALQKEQMLEVENKKKEIEDLATKDPSLKKLSKIDPSFINTYSQIAVEQGLYGHELKGLASDYTVFQPGSIYYAPDKQTGQLLPHKFIKGKLYSIREPEFKQKGI
jgi:hypothetical protein